MNFRDLKGDKRPLSSIIKLSSLNARNALNAYDKRQRYAVSLLRILAETGRGFAPLATKTADGVICDVSV
jgi:hypothetical protein